MPPLSRTRPLAALTASALLVGGLAAGLPAGAARTAVVDEAPARSGIGDDYFPLDGSRGIDVSKYDVRVRYDLATGRLVGRTRLTVRATRDLDRFGLDLLLPVRSVRVDGAPASFRKPHPHELKVTPRRTIEAGDRFRVVVRYAGRPGSIGYLGERNWLANRHEVVTMNEPHMAPWWFPANDHPADKARFDIRVTMPRGTEVIANGELRGRQRAGRLTTTHWRAAEPMAPYLAFFAAGQFRTASGVHEGRPWYAAVSQRLGRGAERRAMRLMKQTPAIVEWTEDQLGPYPFSTTGGVTTSLQPGFALENQTRPTYPDLGPGGRSIVVHEVAHQWFGNSVSVARWRDIWLNEGAATFVEQLYNEQHGGPSAQDWLEQTYAGYRTVRGFWDVRLADPGPGRIFDNAVYVRGGMAFQALRHRIGDDAFSRLLRTWLATRAGGNGSVPEFTALAEEVSGQDLDGFFQAWLVERRPPARTAENGF